LIVRAERVDAGAVRTTDDNRRQSNASDRLLKQRLILFAVVAALGVGLVLRRRLRAAFARTGLRQSLLWSPQSGRAPPLFSR
ncbi:MAG: hypothetical protein ABI658_28175, partial [Acidimicrobiales bacterium]